QIVADNRDEGGYFGDRVFDIRGRDDTGYEYIAFNFFIDRLLDSTSDRIVTKIQCMECGISSEGGGNMFRALISDRIGLKIQCMRCGIGSECGGNTFRVLISDRIVTKIQCMECGIGSEGGRN